MKVVGIGDNVIDIYCDQKVMYVGGNALNFCVFSEEVGSSSSFVGNFGNDELSKFAISTLKKLNIDISHSKRLEGENGYSKVNLNNGDREFIYSNRGGVLKNKILLEQDDLDFINRNDLVHFNINGNSDDYLKYINGPKIVYDFSDLFDESIIKRNAPYIDLACFSCPKYSEKEMFDLIDKVKKIGIERVLCTSGAKGAWINDGNHVIHVPAHIVSPIDTMGAGDSFIAYVSNNIFGKDKSKKIKDILTEASYYSSKQVMRNGSFGYGRRFFEGDI